MSGNVIYPEWTTNPKLDVPWESVRDFVFSFGYNPDDTKELDEFIYKAFDLIVTEDNQ
jgi:hypothetical protein